VYNQSLLLLLLLLITGQMMHDKVLTCMTGCMVRTTKGKDTNTIASATPRRVNTTGMPNASSA
jgi:hypothetical protein